MEKKVVESRCRVSIPSDLFAGETVWVSMTGPRRGIVDNVCVASKRITLGDEIRFKECEGLPQFTRMLQRGPFGMIRFLSKLETSESAVKALVDKLVATGVQLEGMRMGKGGVLYGLAVPHETMDTVIGVLVRDPVVEIFEQLRP